VFLEWVAGVLFRPAATFERARQNLRFGYYWILLSVFTLEIVGEIYSPPIGPSEPPVAATDVALWVALILMIRFDLQALLLLGAARAFGWRISWAEALKYIGLAWSVLLVEDIATFYLALKGYYTPLMWLGIPFFLWYLISLSAGVRRLSALPWWEAALLTLLASVPWRAAEFWLTWRALHP
jgi:hypothetical protein